ncbi:MAG: glycosyltransferase family 9 protein [Ignavibacteriaceae bacterium]|nr:glycosyltransferase family 9 protein [Ignavibacteriaceae bacterium]
MESKQENLKILVFALSGIGDALMFTPALKLIRENFPAAIIDAVVMFKPVENIYQRTGLLNTVTRFDFLAEGGLKSLKFVLSLRGKYTHSINVYPSNRKEYNIVNFLAGAKKRGAIKYNRMDFVEAGFLNNVRIQEDDNLHNVEENILLVEKMFNFSTNFKPQLFFPLNDDDNALAQKFIIENSLENRLIIGFHPGCATLKNHKNRRWEPHKFAELANVLIKEFNANVLLFGGPEEKELREEISNLVQNKNLIKVETKSMSESAAIIKKCNLFVTNDSSLMHVASAMGVHVVPVIGPTNLKYIYPWGTEYSEVSLNLECAPCFFYSPKPLNCGRQDIKYKCIKELGVSRVADKIRKLINS